MNELQKQRDEQWAEMEKNPNMHHRKKGDAEMAETERRNQEEAATHNWTTLRQREIWLLKGGHWADSEQALEEQDWAGTAFRDLPIYRYGESWGVVRFHFRGSYDSFYTVSEWTKSKYGN